MDVKREKRISGVGWCGAWDGSDAAWVVGVDAFENVWEVAREDASLRVVADEEVVRRNEVGGARYGVVASVSGERGGEVV